MVAPDLWTTDWRDSWRERAGFWSLELLHVRQENRKRLGSICMGDCQDGSIAVRAEKIACAARNGKAHGARMQCIFSYSKKE